ncbi:MAG: TRAP transporter small permease subunit, partial [Clostridiales bacterium]|nr:TRAP transporter small permease subunit [Clostridiales bacterium]
MKVISRLDVIISGLALTLIVFLTLAGALSRRFLNQPFVWLEEIQLFLEVWVVFLGAGAAFRTGSHVAIEVVVDALPEKAKKVIDVIISGLALTLIVFLTLAGALSRRFLNQPFVWLE